MNQRQRKHGRRTRKGGIIVLVSVLIVVLIAMAAFTVDVAYMQMVRTELRASTDAAARAGAEALARTQNKNTAIQAAIDTAARNRVGGRAHQVAAAEVLVGAVTRKVDGSWAFAEGGSRLNAVRVNSDLSAGSTHGPVGLFFGGALGTKNFAPRFSATAAQSETDICLAIDRSHSMCFDLSGIDWRYPNMSLPLSVLYKLAPDPTRSRWAALQDSVSAFCDIIQLQNPRPRVGLVTWASDMGSGYPVIAKDVGLNGTTTDITNALKSRGSTTMMGATNCAAGIDAAVAMLKQDTTRPYANKIVILMTDGQWNQGRSPVEAAKDAAAQGVVVHVVTLLPNANQPDMDQIAAITGGEHYHANDRAALIAAFEKLARTLPTMLTE
jgi:Ca-activated chloride channel homolog